MAWIEPKTDWTASDRVTPSVMNRICGNLNVLLPTGNLKEDFTLNDFVTVSQWNQILSTLNQLNAVTGLSSPLPGSDMTAETFNQVEGLIQQFNDRIEVLLNQTKASSYSGDLIYAAENYASGY
ncbi:MAG: hypothetical protein LKE59_10460 [Eubacterium sp.]|jgi:hypothetical protein|nr:hypothetical protein [Eubacterium sp.]MCH4078573.1 hypothetical protein [Eubacterium sp.]MCH4109714.1 hypothetical protein [Eubacterium sp.]